jgi:hypothetical protein
MHKTNYITLYQSGGGFFSTVSNLLGGLFGGKKPETAEIENKAQENIASSRQDMGSLGTGDQFDQNQASNTGSNGGISANMMSGLGGSLVSEWSTIQNAKSLPSQSQKTEAIADGTVNAVGSALSVLGPWGAVAGTALKAINGIGGSLMNNNATARAADHFKINGQVAQSSGYGGINSAAQMAQSDGQGYRKAGLFGKLLTDTGALNGQFANSNIQQGQASSILTANKKAQQGAASSSDMFANNTMQKNYNGSMWNNGSITFGKKGTKLHPIHIKKSHEGKFTEFKKRTGETTEEAKHSSDPHVRKMATFAANAKTWKHQQGGSLQIPYAYQPAIGTSKNYMSGYGTGYGSAMQFNNTSPFDQYIKSQSANSELEESQSMANMNSKNSGFLDNDAVDFFKGQRDAFDQLLKGQGKPQQINAKLLAPKLGPQAVHGQKVAVAQQGGTLNSSGSTQTKTTQEMFGKLGVATHQVNLKRFKNIKKRKHQDGGIMQKDHTEYKHDPIAEPNHGYSKWLNSLPQRLQESTDYDLKGYFNKYGSVGVVGDQHLTDEFKKPNHVTFSNESVYNSPEHQGGQWRQNEGKWEFVASPWNIKNVGVDSLQTYFKQNEPNAKLILPPMSHKEGGPINVIADGAFHSRKHDLKELPELEDANITLKGIPVVSEIDGELVQHAEIEVSELILHYDLTKQLEELLKDNTDECAIKAGKLLSEEIIKNTKDNSAQILKNTK